MEWTKEVPTKAGWYWWKDSQGNNQTFQNVSQSLLDGISARQIPYGLWYGPIEPPPTNRYLYDSPVPDKERETLENINGILEDLDGRVKKL